MEIGIREADGTRRLFMLSRFSAMKLGQGELRAEMTTSSSSRKITER